MQVKSIAECSKGLSTFIKLSLSLRSLFCLFSADVLHRFYFTLYISHGYVLFAMTQNQRTVVMSTLLKFSHQRGPWLRK